MSQRNFNNTSTIGTLTGPVAASATSAVVTNFTGIPTAPFTVTIDRNTPTEEVCLVTAVAGGTLTIVRGYDGTAGQAHSAGATIEHTAGAIEYSEANQHTNATSGAHGVTGSVVGNQGTQTIYDKTLVSPVVQADITKGDAVVAVIPSGATVRNLFCGVGADGNNKITVDSSGVLTAAGVNLTTLNSTVAGHTTSIATANSNISSNTTAIGLKADKTYVDSQDTATLNSAKSYTDGKFSDTGWVDVSGSLGSGFTAGADGTRYRVLNGVCFYQFHILRSAAGTIGTVYTFPTGIHPSTVHWGLWEAAGVVQGEAKITGTTGLLTFFFPWAGSGASTVAVLSGSFPIG